jgi:cytochrome P450 / NADPH-cytochrome P450 reductase
MLELMQRELSSGLLSFITYELLKNPHAYAKVREEVDTVLQGERIRPGHLGKLPYIVAVLREGLRMWGPVTIIGLTPFEDTTLCGEYFIPKDTVIYMANAWLHRDPAVWGDDVSCLFEPESRAILTRHDVGRSV